MLFPSKKERGVIDTVLTPLYLVISSLLTKSEYLLEHKDSKDIKGKDKNKEAALGVLVTILLLVVIVPLLSSANPFFERVVSDIVGFLNLAKWFEFLSAEIIFIWALRIILAIGFLFMIPRVITFMNKSFDAKPLAKFQQFNFPLFLPMTAISFVLFVFFITQIRFYFAGDEVLNSLGISLSERSREVFGQLSVVAGIIFGLIYNNKIKKGLSGLLEKILVGEGVFLVLMAYKSVFEYINMWGLTYKRLYGVTVATWVLGVFLFYVFKEVRQKTSEYLVGKILFFTGVILIAINALNFDYLIYHANKARTGQGTDYAFLTNLSADSLSFKSQLDQLDEADKQTVNKQEFVKENNPTKLLLKVERLKNKYDNFDLRTWTLLDYLQYRSIKDIQIEKLFERFSQPSYRLW